MAYNLISIEKSIKNRPAAQTNDRRNFLLHPRTNIVKGEPEKATIQNRERHDNLRSHLPSKKKRLRDVAQDILFLHRGGKIMENRC